MLERNTFVRSRLLARLVLVATLFAPSLASARSIKSVEITNISNHAVSCGSSTTVTVEVTVKVPNNFVGPERGTVEILEYDRISDDVVGSATYTVRNTDIGNNNTGKVSTTVTLNCYTANSDCECDFGNRPNQLDDEYGEHTIYAREKDSGKKSPPNGLTGNYIDIISCLKSGGKLAMSYGDFAPGGTTLVAVNFDQAQPIDQLDWTFRTNGEYFSIVSAGFGPAVAASFDAALVDFGAHRPGEVSFRTLNEIPRDVLVDGDFDFFFEVAVSPEAPYGEFALSTVEGSGLWDSLGRVVPIEHPRAQLPIVPADETAPVIDASLIRFDATNLTVEAEPGAIYDDFLGALDYWVEVDAQLIDAFGEISSVGSVDVADDGHFILSDIVTGPEDMALVLIASDGNGNASEHQFLLQETPNKPGAGYDVAVASTGEGFGYFFDLGPCGQLAGWVDEEGRGVPALNVGGEVRTHAAPGRLAHGLGVNARNWIAGQYQVDSGFAPFVLDPATGFHALPALEGGRGTVYAIDDSSRWAVGMATGSDAPTAPYLPVVWLLFEEGGEVWAETLPLPAVGGEGGFARDLNNLGNVVGTAADSQNRYHAVIWEQVEPGYFEVRDLGVGTASAITDGGIVVGTLLDRSGQNSAFVHASGRTTFLAAPARCMDCETHAVDVNERGDVIGFSRDSNGAITPLLWSLETGEQPIDLRAEFPEALKLEGIRLEVASRINDAGQILAGGKIGDTPVGLVLTPSTIDGDGNQIPDACEESAEEFSRGDVNSDGNFDIADPINILDMLFGGGEPSSCLDATDINDDGAVDISDAVTGLAFLFLGSETIAAPFPACGVDETPDSLGCETAPACATAEGEDSEVFVTTPCPGGNPTGVVMARHECRDGFIHEVDYEGFVCPDGSLQWVEQSAVASNQRCP